MEPLVSILIPVYNSEQFLQECLDSVINQTYSNYEIVAIDDGSTDNSLKILQKYPTIQTYSQKNQGLASAINAGISHCKGDYIKWISPDDVMYRNCLEELVKYADSDVIIYSNWDIIDENSKHLRNFSETNYNPLDSFDFAVRLLDGQQINVNTTLIPSSLFGKCKIQDLEDPVAIDYDFFLNAALNHSIRFFLVEKPLIQYRVHTKQLSHKNITKTLSFLDRLKEQHLSQLDYDTREKYQKAIQKYQKNMPFNKRILKQGLGIISKLPAEISDFVLVYYLNHIRSQR